MLVSISSPPHPMPHQVATSADWKNAAQLTADAAAADSLHDMGEVLIRGAHALFQAELVILDQFDEKARQLAYQMYPPVTPEIARLQPAFMALWHEHPYTAEWVKVIGGGRISFLSDRVTSREFRRTGLWNEVYIHLRAKNQLMMGGQVQPSRYWCLSLNRLGRDFEPRERELGRFLQPRITQLLQQQARRERAHRAMSILAHPDSAYLLVSNTGCVLEASPGAHSLLEAIGPTSSGKIMAAASAFAPQAQAAFRTHLIDGCQAVILRPVPHAPSLVMIARSPRNLPAGRHRLTRRESETLHWIGEGKTNAEIAALLGIGSRTVEKHCEGVFQKLGVDNRLGAGLLARQLVNPGALG